MSMNGRYARLTPAELERTLREPGWGEEFVNELAVADWDEQREASAARCHGTEKAWHALDFLLGRIGFPVDIVHGEEDIPGAEDWGHSPPCMLSPKAVRVAAEALAALPVDALVRDVTPADLALAGIYPVEMWERGESLAYVTSRYQTLVPFFQAADRAGDTVVVWLQ
ncbi:YfbM family protein [Streptomyces sp. NPDC048428]|uniref:YfbM family protein n=1 Tax=Streptomyces sp. NPDC048428 TaxID=3154503 RepID=UPI00341F79CA